MEQLLNEAKRLTDAGYLSQAESLIRASLVLNNENPELLKALAQILIQSNQYEAAAEIAQILATLKEKSIEIEVEDELAQDENLDSIVKKNLNIDFDYAVKLEREELSNNLLSDIESYKPRQDIYYSDESQPERTVDITSISDAFEDDEDIVDDVDELSDDDQFSVDDLADEAYALPIDDDAPSRRELTHIPNIESRKARAHQIALKIANDYEFTLSGVELLQTIFFNHWWSKTQTVIRSLLDSGATEKELSLAYEVRKLWTYKSEFHEVIWGSERVREYKSLPWATCLDLVCAYHSYPQIEEIEGYLDEAYQEWAARSSLQKQFNSFFGMVQEILENCHGEEPPSMSDFRSL
jgi:hypothetical protein